MNKAANQGQAAEFVDRLLRRPEVEAAVGLKKTAIYQMVQDGTFPRPVRITGRAVRWRLSTVTAWIDAKAGPIK